MCISPPSSSLNLVTGGEAGTLIGKILVPEEVSSLVFGRQ